MSYTVIVALFVQLLFLIGLPCYLIAKRKEYGVKPYFSGAICYVIFSLAGAGLLAVVFTVYLPTNDALNNSPFLYSLFSGITAAVCGELGRFLFIKTALKDKSGEQAVNFGIGYASFHLAIILGVTIVIYIIVAFSIIKGSINTALFSEFYDIFETVKTLNAFSCFLGVIEAVILMALQVFLSVIVFEAVKSKKILYLFFALLLHFAYDFSASLYSSGMISYRVVATMLMAVTAFISSGLAVPLYKKGKETLKSEA